ncbi:INTS5 family protein [Megaselia abdita]
MLTHILTELNQFITGLSKTKDYLSPHSIDTSIRILNQLPAARDLVFEYFSIVFEISVSNYLSSIDCRSESTVRIIEEELDLLLSKGTPEWSIYIASWSLEVIGNISHKHWRKTDIASSCNFWLNLEPMKILLGLTSTCFKKLGSDSENSIRVLLSIFRKYSPTFDWVVSRLANCFPLQIIAQIFQSGLRKFADDTESRFHSEVGILEYLSSAHENDLKKAISLLMEEGFSPTNEKQLEIVPFLLEMCNYSEIILHFISTVFLEIYNEELLSNIVKFTTNWMQNKSFQNMQPAFNNLLLKLKSGCTKIIIIVAKLTMEFKWCNTFLEYTLQELEQIVLLNRSCAMLQNLSTEESKELLWESCRSNNRVEQQTAIRLIILVSSKFTHIYDQTIADLLQMNYNDDSENIWVLTRLLGGMNGIVEYSSIKPGIDIILDDILLNLEIKREISTKSQFFFKNMYTVVCLSETESVFHFNSKNIINLLEKCVSKILEIFSYAIQIIEKILENKKAEVVKHLYNSTEISLPKKNRLEGKMLASNRLEISHLEKSFNLIGNIVDLLNKMHFLNEDKNVNVSTISRLPCLTVKYFFNALHLENSLSRSDSVEKSLSLLKYQCNNNKICRQSCLRDLLEKGIFNYGYLFGCYEDLDIVETGINKNESLLRQNRKQIGLNSHRSVLHAGLIGEGLRKRTWNQCVGMEPDDEIQNLYLKAITLCCMDIEKPDSSEGFMAMSLFLVEFISTDFMYNGLPFPDEEFAKSTVERDLLIKRAFLLSPILWSLLGLLAQYRPALCFSSVLLRAICATCLHHWRAKNVNKINIIPKNDETLICTKKLLQVMAMGQLLPPPLSNLHDIITCFDSNEISLILKECVWNYLKDHVPSPALFQCDKNGLHWRNPVSNKVQSHYINVLKSIMQKKIEVFQSNYYGMFVMFEDKSVS